jgi:hypothetical protein
MPERHRPRPGTVVGAAVLALLLTACGEPAVDLVVPPRTGGQHVADLAGILDDGELATELDALRAAGVDVVALTFETPQASCGEAHRAGGALLDAWDADVAIVAVAAPGDFTSTGDPRTRCVGIRPRQTGIVPGGVREEIAEQVVPPLAADNDWDGAFRAAVDRIAGATG